MYEHKYKASDFPQELWDLFDSYVHGRIDRRAFMEGAGKFAVGGLTAAAIFDILSPKYAEAQRCRRTTAA
jgi:carboxymethylenebutenolidase